MNKVRFTSYLTGAFMLTFLLFGMSLSLFAQDGNTPNMIKKKVIVKTIIDEDGNVQTETIETEVDVDENMNIEGDFDIDIDINEDGEGMQQRIVKVRIDGDGDIPESVLEELEGMGVDINILDGSGAQGQMIIIDEDEEINDDGTQERRIIKMKAGEELPEDIRKKLEEEGIDLDKMLKDVQSGEPHGFRMKRMMPGMQRAGASTAIDRQTQIIRIASIDKLDAEILKEIEAMGVTEAELRQRFAEADNSIRIRKEGVKPAVLEVDQAEDVETSMIFFGENGEKVDIKGNGNFMWITDEDERTPEINYDFDALEEHIEKLKLPENKKPFLGVVMGKSEKGALISEVVGGSAAAEAGLQAGDVIIAIDKKTIEHTEDVIKAIQASEIGKSILITYLRNGLEDVSSATLKGNKYQPIPFKKIFKENRPFMEDLRISTKRGYLGVTLDNDGTVIRVQPESAAADAGIEKDDKIIQIGEMNISNAEDVSCAMRQSLPGTNTDVTFEREGKELTVTVVPNMLPRKKQHKTCSPFDKERWVERMKEECEQRCNTPFLGVYMESKDRDFEDYDVLITGIVQNTGAEDAGVLKGDIIRKVDKTNISKIDDVVDVIRAKKPGDMVKLILDRNGKKTRIKATLSNMTQNDLFSPCDCNTGEVNTEAMTTKEIIIFKSEEQTEMPQVEITPERLLELDNVELFPNPNNGVFTFNFESRDKVPTRISVVDVNGKEIYAENLPNFDGRYNNRINISNQSKGTYFLNVIQGEKIFTRQFVYGKERF